VTALITFYEAVNFDALVEAGFIASNADQIDILITKARNGKKNTGDRRRNSLEKQYLFVFSDFRVFVFAVSTLWRRASLRQRVCG
jgi:hypothetical protein